jgi:GAF domain-containing protein
MTTSGDRLELLYDVARRVSTFSNLDGLLRYATQRTRELLDAECCSVLLLDDTGKRLYFPVASQAASGRPAPAEPEDLIFPSDRGIAGWVLRHDQAIAVDDAAHDPRFYSGVDQATGRATHALLCAPLRTRDGIIGVVEVMNPVRGTFAAADVPFLEAIAADLAVACENARLCEALRRESLGLRNACGMAGIGLAVLGLATGLGGLYAHLGSALPLGELLTRWSTITAVVLLGMGGALGAIARGRIVPSADTRRPPEFYAARSGAT